jgi:hypothetical protein
MASFSKRELDFIKRLHLAEKEASNGGFKTNKAELYRSVFQKKDMGSKSAHASASKISKKFKTLEKNEKDIMLQNLELENEKEKLENERKKQSLEFAYLQGQKETQKKFFSDFEDGKKMAEKNMERLASAIDFSTKKGVLNFLEHIGTIFLSKFHEEAQNKEILQNGAVVVGLAKSLVDTAKLGLGLDFTSDEAEIEEMNKLNDFLKQIKQKNVN